MLGSHVLSQGIVDKFVWPKRQEKCGKCRSIWNSLILIFGITFLFWTFLKFSAKAYNRKLCEANPQNVGWSAAVRPRPSPSFTPTLTNWNWPKMSPIQQLSRLTEESMNQHLAVAHSRPGFTLVWTEFGPPTGLQGSLVWFKWLSLLHQ